MTMVANDDPFELGELSGDNNVCRTQSSIEESEGRRTLHTSGQSDVMNFRSSDLHVVNKGKRNQLGNSMAR